MGVLNQFLWISGANPLVGCVVSLVVLFAEILLLVVGVREDSTLLYLCKLPWHVVQTVI